MVDLSIVICMLVYQRVNHVSFHQFSGFLLPSNDTMRQMSMKKAAITSRVMPSFLRFGSAQLAAKRGSVATSGQPVATPLSMEVYQVCW